MTGWKDLSERGTTEGEPSPCYSDGYRGALGLGRPCVLRGNSPVALHFYDEVLQIACAYAGDA